MKTLVMGIFLGLSWSAVARPVMGVKELLTERWALTWRHVETYVEDGRTSIPLFSKILEDTGQVGEVLRHNLTKFTAGTSFWLNELGYPPLADGQRGVANAVAELGNLANSLAASDTQQEGLQLLQQVQHLFTVELAATRLLELARSEVVINGKQWQLLQEVVALRNKARDAAQANLTPTMEEWEKLHNYHQHSLIPFVSLLDSTDLDIRSLAYKDILDINRLHAYRRGEAVFSEEEFDALATWVKKHRELEVLEYSINSTKRFPLDQVLVPPHVSQSHLKSMHSSWRIEQDAQMLQERAVQPTPVQKELIAKVARLRSEALAQLDKDVDSHAIKHYQEAQTTAAFLLADILTKLGMSVAKLTLVSGVSDKAIMAQQLGKATLNEEDAALVIASLIQALDGLSAPSWWRQICNSVGKNRTCFAAHKQYISRLLADFTVALRVERYLQDKQPVVVE